MKSASSLLPMLRRMGLAVGCIGFAGWATNLALSRLAELRQKWPAEADVMYLPASSMLRRLSLGHHELAADLVMARSAIYFGTQLTQKAPQTWLGRYLNSAADLDPMFHRIYLAGAAMLVYGGRVASEQDVLSSNALLARGNRAFPGDWELWFQRGFNLFFELPQIVGTSSEKAARYRQEGLGILREVATFSEAPPWMSNLVSRLLTKQGETDLAIRHLEQAYVSATSEETRKQIVNKLGLLQASSRMIRLDSERARFDAIVNAGYRYSPEAFTLITGPRRARSVPSISDRGSTTRRDQ